jgi:hypothetical protein
VQFWLRPGEAEVTLGAGEEWEVERIPEQLRRFLGSSPKRAKSMVRACPPRTNSRVISLYLWDTKLPFDKEHRPLASALLFASTGFDGGTQTGLLQQPLVGASTTTIRGELCTLE